MSIQLYKLRCSHLVPPLMQGRRGVGKSEKGNTTPDFSFIRRRRKKTNLFNSSPGIREARSEGGEENTTPNPSYIRRGIGGQTPNPSTYQIGFTLIETLIAIALLLAVLVGPITLIAHSLFSTSFSRNNLIANNLAQEGIELIRAVRDNNLLCATLGGTMLWDDNPNGPPLKLLDYYELDATRNIDLTCGTDIIFTPRPLRRNLATCNTPIRIDIDGVYNYMAGSPAGFTRCVQVCSPPNAAPCSAVADADIPNNDQMEIISTVSWTERGASKNVTLRDRLYRWQ